MTVFSAALSATVLAHSQNKADAVGVALRGVEGHPNKGRHLDQQDPWAERWAGARSAKEQEQQQATGEEDERREHGRDPAPRTGSLLILGLLLDVRATSRRRHRRGQCRTPARRRTGRPLRGSAAVTRGSRTRRLADY